MLKTAPLNRGITARGLRKVYSGAEEDVVAVAGIDFEVVPGQIFGLLGPNGAGKTTTLRMLATLLAPTAGDVWIEGFHCRKHSVEVRKRIGFQTGSTGTYDRLTGREMIAFFGRLHGLGESRITTRIELLVQQFQMEEFQNRLCGRLSTGQKQKISIARTVVHDPPVLIFDEPISGLDVLVAQTVLEFIKASREQGKTLILSTHRMQLAQRLCDRVAIIYDGRILARGTCAEICEEAEAEDLEEAFFTLTRRCDQEKSRMDGMA